MGVVLQHCIYHSYGESVYYRLYIVDALATSKNMLHLVSIPRLYSQKT